jgi:GNAT superfamily N-acetyltransferase
MDVTYQEIGPAEFRAAISALVAVYAAAMNPPDRMLAGRDAIMERHAGNPGFRCLVGYADGLVAGFGYGFHGMPGQWWHDMVAGALAMRSANYEAAVGAPGDRAPGDRARAGLTADIGPSWLDDSFEVAELHVLPRFQGGGVGRRLLLTGADRAVVHRGRADQGTAAVPGGGVRRPADRIPLRRRRAALRGDGRAAATGGGPLPEAEHLVELKRRAGGVERVEVQPRDALGEQPRG